MIPLPASILTAAPAPVRIVTGQETSATPSHGQDLFAWASVLCIVAAVCLVLWRYRRRKQRPPEIRAFELLARRLSITATERALVQRMAIIHGQISPLAMLVSPAAFTRCRESLDSTSIGGNRAALDELTRKLR